ncbi:MAG: DUF3305 domain-containing protein [Candidatus Competibacterales bacterium]|nr:DUF3305 domain-containing protein [Candidatus Competibacterales bacterium]
MNDPRDPLQEDTGPARFDVAVVMQRRASASRWLSETWQAVAVVASSREPVIRAAGESIRRHPGGTEDFLWGGFRLHLYRDQAESYYHNLKAPTPCLYVITRTDETTGRPEPFRVSASFDEANAYTETDADAFPVPMPPEIHQWIERFVLAHFVPERPHKRRRQNWKEDNRP